MLLRICDLPGMLLEALRPLEAEIELAFVFGSVATKEDSAESDIDLFVVSGTLAYAELASTLEPVSSSLRRTVHPVLYSPKQIGARVNQKNSFVLRVFSRPKIWLIGSDARLEDLASDSARL